MLTFDDCLAFSELTEAEILAIAEHENLPEVAAIALGNYLLHSASGEQRIERMILEDIRHSQHRGNHRRAAELKRVLNEYCRHRSDRSPPS